MRDAGEFAHGRGFDAGMRLWANVDYGLDAFRGRGTGTPFVGAWNGASCAPSWTDPLGEALRFGVEATRSGSASMPTTHGVRLSATAHW